MARFYVNNSFPLESRKLFVLAGSIVEGVIRPGMFVRLPSNSAVGKTARIHSIEFARRADGKEDDTRLCIRCDEPEEIVFWEELNIEDETVDVIVEGENESASRLG